ncbi:hypothetical protein ACFX1X_026913 [Malus domestica]
MSSSSPNPDASKKHFALIAGASHGARCWYKLSALLTSAGYDVTALGLAACGVHPEEDLKLALSLLRFCPLGCIHDEIKLANEKYGSVRKVFIVCDLLAEVDGQ